jgi:hypothetical protein
MVAIAYIGVVASFLLARRWERDGRPERFVALVLGVLLVESLLFTSQPNTPVGLFRIPLGAGNLRTLDVLIACGVLARMSVRPFPTRVTGNAVVWFLAGAWLAVAAIRGVMVGHQTNLVLFTCGSLVGLFGAMVLVAGCDVHRLIALARSWAVVPLGVVMLFVVPNEASPEPIALLGTELGWIHPDTASVFVVLATFVVLVEWSAIIRQRWMAWAALPLLVSPFTVPQRATLVQLAVTVLVVGSSTLTTTWRERFHVARLQLLKGVLAVVAVLAVVVILQLRENRNVPFAGYYEQTFTAPAQQSSAQARRESLVVGIEEWLDAPLFGHGLGHTYRIVRPFGSGLAEPTTFDNVPLDLFVRVGLVGVALVVGATLWTMRDGYHTWRRHADAQVAAFAFAGLAALAGLVAKSIFESIIEKGKIAVIMGVVVGAILSANRSSATRPSTPHRPTLAGRTPAPMRVRQRPIARQGDTTWT